MLQALFHNKLGRAIRDGSFKAIEYTLTSSVIGRLQYRPDDLFWYVLRNSCGASSEKLPESIGAILDVHFWERLDAAGTHNTRQVEPDVWVEADKCDLIIEAKITDSAADNSQNLNQWFNEIVALKNIVNRSEGRDLLFLAIGGNNTLKDQEIEINGAPHVIHTGSWFDLLGGVLNLRDKLAQEQGTEKNNLRILDDVVSAMQYHNIMHTVWLDSLHRDIIMPDASSFVLHRWEYDNRGFFDVLYDSKNQIGIESLSSIWIIK